MNTVRVIVLYNGKWINQNNEYKFNAFLNFLTQVFFYFFNLVTYKGICVLSLVIGS